MDSNQYKTDHYQDHHCLSQVVFFGSRTSSTEVLIWQRYSAIYLKTKQWFKKNEKVETLKLRMRRRIRGARPVVVRGWNACTNIFKRRRKYLYVDWHVLQQKIKLLWHRTWKYLKSEEFLYVAAKLYSSYAGWWPLENCKWAR